MVLHCLKLMFYLQAFGTCCVFLSIHYDAFTAMIICMKELGTKATFV